jgi:hypothetical protein
VDWFGRLKSVLGPPENRVVYCAGGSTARLLLESDIRYDLFLFDFDLLNETGSNWSGWPDRYLIDSTYQSSSSHQTK